jgi:chemotaxis signal transduction protein
MDNGTRKNNKTLVYDPFADLDGEMVKDVLGYQPSQILEAPAADKLPELLESLERTEFADPVPPVEPVQHAPDLAAEEPGEMPEVFLQIQAEVEDEPAVGTAPLLELLVSNLEDFEPVDVLAALAVESFEDGQVEPAEPAERSLSEELFNRMPPEEPELSEQPSEVLESFEEGLEKLLVAPIPAVEEEQDFLEEIVRQIDEEGDEPDLSGDVFGLTRKTSPDAATLKRHVVFSIGSTEYAVPILTVSEVVRPLKITPVPNVPEWLLGVANLRGDIISVVDLRVFFGQVAPENLPSNRMLVVHSQNEEVTTGLIVDRAGGIFDLPQEQIRSPSAPIDDKVSPFMHGVSEVNDRLLVVLDLNHLLLSTEMEQFQ